MHNSPGLEAGSFAIRSGALMAATDEFELIIEGEGGHAARPHQTIDPILVGTQIYQAVQGVVARNVDPLQSAVISITAFNSGDAFNIIPQRARLRGTVRTMNPEIRDLIEMRMRAAIENIVTAHGAKVDLNYMRGYPMTINHEAQTNIAAGVAMEIAGKDNVDIDRPVSMGSEDFSYMLEERPGAMMFIGNGDSAKLHNEEYDFNDEIIPAGCSYWVRLVETTLPVE